MAVIQREPLCRLCKLEAKHIDHIDNNPHNQRNANLQPLCKPCHDWKTQVFDIHGGLGHLQSFADLTALLCRLHKTDDTKKWPVYVVVPQAFLCTQQFTVMMYASWAYNMYAKEYIDRAHCMHTWNNVATPVLNEAKQYLDSDTILAIDDLFGPNCQPQKYGQNHSATIEGIRSIMVNVGITPAEIVRIVAILHFYEHCKQGA